MAEPKFPRKARVSAIDIGLYCLYDKEQGRRKTHRPAWFMSTPVSNPGLLKAPHYSQLERAPAIPGTGTAAFLSEGIKNKSVYFTKGTLGHLWIKS